MYPIFGTGYLYEKMAKKIINQEVSIINLRTLVSNIKMNVNNSSQIQIELNDGKNKII